ncbi:MAG: FtsX-like permease family protein [Flammeovirgaceae bacterium]|nr:FtsX-like permease family protein [Flammeovirgaceae bacterium]
MQFDWIIPAQEYIQRNEWVESWYNGAFRTYICLREDADINAMRLKVEQEVNNHTNNEANEPLYLQLFADNYLNATFENGVPIGGRIQYVNVLLAIAVFLLLIACINFMNLATARSSTRAREIGVRKVMGAHRGTLSQQFFSESFLHAFFSMAVAVLVVYLTLPYFNTLTGKSLILEFESTEVWLFIIGMTLVTGLLSGSYPALMLSSFTIIRSLKGLTKIGKGAYFRNGLVTFQFAISIFLICGTLIVSKQMDFILNKDLGLEKENVIMVRKTGELNRLNDVYKTSLAALPEIKQVTFASGNPLSYGSSTGGARWDGKNPDDVIEINVLSVDADFLQTMGMRLVEGRDFSNNVAVDSAHYIVNEVLATIMGFDSPVGKGLYVWGVDGTVIGVVKNFHMDSMYEPIAPLIIRYDPGNTSVAFIRTQGNVKTAIEEIEAVTKKLNPAFPVRYQFLDQEYSQAYQGEKTVSTLVNIFAGVSIFISCLGLLGLSSFTADQRSKEIGIRKIHGATSWRLVLLLSRHYAKLMVLAFIMATPIAYFYMQNWLSDFAFRVTPGLLLFIVAGIIAFVLGTLTVSIKSYQAAITNPINTLREE